jgi:hypothetical protein
MGELLFGGHIRLVRLSYLVPQDVCRRQDGDDRKRRGTAGNGESLCNQ